MWENIPVYGKQKTSFWKISKGHQVCREGGECHISYIEHLKIHGDERCHQVMEKVSEDGNMGFLCMRVLKSKDARLGSHKILTEWWCYPNTFGLGLPKALFYTTKICLCG